MPGIKLDTNKPRGLPFLKPLYGLPPYQYTGDVVFMVVYETDESAIREVLPSQLEPLPGNVVAMCFFLCPDVTGMGPHNFAMPCIPVRYGDETAQFIPYLYTSTDASLACYREVQGWPAVFGQIEIVTRDGRIKASVERNGREVMKAEATVSGDEITTLDFLPVLLYKEIPSFDGTGCDAAYFVITTSRLTNLSLKAGTGDLEFTAPGDDPIARLKVRKVQSVLFGTLDDYYPETIRVLK